LPRALRWGFLLQLSQFFTLLTFTPFVSLL
jgi:hypothetical protein